MKKEKDSGVIDRGFKLAQRESVPLRGTLGQGEAGEKRQRQRFGGAPIGEEPTENVLRKGESGSKGSIQTGRRTGRKGGKPRFGLVSNAAGRRHSGEKVTSAIPTATAGRKEKREQRPSRIGR